MVDILQETLETEQGWQMRQRVETVLSQLSLASEEPVDIPPWMLRRCRQLLHQSGDRVEGP